MIRIDDQDGKYIIEGKPSLFVKDHIVLECTRCGLKYSLDGEFDFEGIPAKYHHYFISILQSGAMRLLITPVCECNPIEEVYPSLKEEPKKPWWKKLF